MIALIDYDAGNIKSVEKAFQSLGKEVVLTRDPEVLKRADHVVLPGVGSFGDAMENLNRYHLVPVIHEIVEKGTPFLGICLGLQILFERSEESPGVEFHPSAERGTLIQRHLAGVLRLLCPLLLSESRRGGNYKSNDRVQYTHPCIRGKRKSVRLPVPPGKEFRSWTCHSEKFCGNWRGGLSDVYKTNYPMPGCKKRKSRKRR